ncbi:MAG: hypothetical protein NVSMB52_21150 [Chloroflexota bacterium]
MTPRWSGVTCGSAVPDVLAVGRANGRIRAVTIDLHQLLEDIIRQLDNVASALRLQAMASRTLATSLG